MTHAELAARLVELEERALAVELSAFRCDRFAKILAVHAAESSARAQGALSAIRKLQDCIRSTVMENPTQEI
jgi:hypothetical protein